MGFESPPVRAAGPLREIAAADASQSRPFDRHWAQAIMAEAARLHHAYALARQEFRATLLAVLAFHQPGSPAELEQEAASLLKALS